MTSAWPPAFATPSCAIRPPSRRLIIAPRHGLDRALFQKLSAGAWIDAHENIILCGPTGPGDMTPEFARLRHLIWNSYHREAHDELFGMRHMALEVAYLNGEKFRPAVARFLWNCDDLRRYLANNTGSLIDYGERYRSKMAVSTSRAEGCVDEIANVRMAKKQRMRWSPQGDHRVAVVRAAVLDGRLNPEANGLMAA